MVISKNFSITIMDPEKISDVNKIIIKYSISSSQSSADALYDIRPINLDELVQDITFFKMACESETALNNQINEMIEELNKIEVDYTLRNEDTEELLVWIKSVGTMNIEFEKIKIIEKGTYEKIDELKNAKTEFGYCKGYKPPFRPIEGNLIENVNIMSEPLFMFSDSRENLLKLKDYLSEKVMEINPNFELEFRILK